MSFLKSCRVLLCSGALLSANLLFFQVTTRADEPATAATEKIELRLRLQKGQSFDQVTIASEKSSEVIRGERFDSYQTLRFGLHFEVLEVSSEGASTLRMTYRSIAGSANLNERLVYEFDSTNSKKPTPLEAESLTAVLGQSVNLTFSAQGVLLKVEGAEALADRIIARLQIPESLQAEMRSTLSQTSHDQVQRVLNNAVFPANAVGIGDSWPGEISLQALPVSIASKYFLLSQNALTASLGVRSKIGPRRDDPETRSDNEAQPKFSGVQQGTIEVDKSTGWARRFEFLQRVIGRLPEAANPEKSGDNPERISGTASPVYVKVMIRGWLVAPPR